MDTSYQAELTERFTAATNSFVDKVKSDPNVIAVIICGSLAYDQVWEKSDIDMTLIVREMMLKNDNYCIIEDEITINVHVMIRSSFKRVMERQVGGSFMQAYYAKGKIVYSVDESLNEYFEDMKAIGKDDIALSAFYNASGLVYNYDKARKWLTVKKDPAYAQFYLLKAAEAIARIEVCIHGEPPSREAIVRALAINPDLMKPYYPEAMSHFYSEDELSRAIEGIDCYLKQLLPIIKQPVIEFMKDQELKTVTLFAKHFQTEGGYIIGVLDYLADQGILVKVSQTIRITPKSKLAVEEIGYIYIPLGNCETRI